jgi:hypothetical protein
MGRRKKMMRRLVLTGGGILVALGLVGVLDALGLIHVSVCGLLWAFLLIAAGVWIIWGSYAKVPSAEVQDITIPLEGATRARIRVMHGAGRLRVKGGAGPGEAAKGSFAGGLEYDVKEEGDLLSVEMRVAGPGLAAGLLPWRWPKSRGAEWSLELNEEIPLTLEFEGGASENLLDLTDLNVHELQVETGASSTKLSLPARAGHTKAHVAYAAGAAEIRVPSDVAARIRNGGQQGRSQDRCQPWFSRRALALESGRRQRQSAAGRR